MLTKCFVCEEADGRPLRWMGERGYAHVTCRPAALRDGAKSIFPFTADHLVVGQSVEVQSMRHARQLEAQHGVHFEVLNNNSQNWDR